MTHLMHRTETKTASFDVPAGTCDCHFHIFGPQDAFPFADERSYTPPEASVAQYRKMAAAIGVERMVIVQASVYGFDNSCTLDAVQQFGIDRARAVVALNVEATEDEIRALHDGGVRGVRLITMAKGGAPLDQLTAIAEKIEPFGWHVQMYVGPDDLKKYADVISSAPVPVVLDHLAHLSSASPRESVDLVLKLLESGNAWIKIIPYRASQEGHPYHDVLDVSRLLLESAPDRCLWGTDWPHPAMDDYMPDDGDLMDLVPMWAPDAGLRKKVLVDNPAVLYGF